MRLILVTLVNIIKSSIDVIKLTNKVNSMLSLTHVSSIEEVIKIL